MSTVIAAVASIPSPPSDAFHVGPLRITYYGIFVAGGLALGFWVTIRRWRARGGDSVLGERVGIWSCVAGFAGARVAYVSTHVGEFSGRWLHAAAIWEGGIAIYGGFAVGIVCAVLMLRHARADVWAFGDSAALGLPLAQAVGRLGNWFNQELFGTPTGLPWAVQIAPGHRPVAFAASPTFHPTFLYEILWDLGVAVLVLVVERRLKPATGNLFLAYVALYGTGRFVLELIRTDTTWRLLGVSRNGWVAAATVVGAVGLGLWRQHRAAAPTGVYRRVP